MPKKSRRYIVTAIIMILIAVGLLAFSTVNFCTECTGWNAINPLCQAGYVSCIATIGTVHWVMRIISGLLIIFAGYKLVKGR